MLRKIEAVDLDGENPYWSGHGVDDDGMHEPTIEWGNPVDLYVDDAYQRDIGPKGLALIKRVAKKGWSWRKYKLPVVTLAETGERVCIDGQHTATMAVSRGVTRIPWLLVKTMGVADQASAFVGQNKDRTAISLVQEHVALLAAGDENAVTLKQVLERCAVTLVFFSKQTFEAGETMALSTIRTLINRRFPVGASKVLRILRAADLAPITAEHIKAVECLLFDPSFKGAIKDEKLTELLRGASGARMLSEGAIFSASHRVPKWKGLTTVLYQARNRAIAA